ncbi:MAG TPA: serine--tRNA ligase [Rhizobiaceae bacterium]|nr:serine--tRNA ligase [Rhizobiaceae bacterium]
MFDIKWIRENPQKFDEGLARRGVAPKASELIELDEVRRMHISRVQEAQTVRNAASKEIGAAMARGDKEKAESLKAQVASLKDQMGAMEAEEREAEAQLRLVLSGIPNLPLDEVPFGTDEHGNVELRRVGTPREFAFKPKEHFEIGEGLGLMDFEAAAKMSGARFTVLKGGLARLERALAQFMLDVHTEENGYVEVSPPLLVRDHAMFGTNQLPKFENDQFWAVHTEGLIDAGPDIGTNFRQNRYGLIPTAEVPLTNLVREAIVDEKELPMRMTAGTYCFRAEAGSAGRDTRGMIRQHQFYKVELVSITTPEQALAEHERMTACAEGILERLGLPFRTMVLCTGDMGFGARKTHDIEVWLPGQDAYREISSCSVCGDFQARRMNARYRHADGKTISHVNTLNGSGVAVGRALVAVLENYQNEDGSVTVPDALRGYMNGTHKIAAAR